MDTPSISPLAGPLVHVREKKFAKVHARAQMERVWSAFSIVHLLGTEVHENLNRNTEINSKISSCYGTLSVLKKLKYLAPYNVRKYLAECLILSKIDYNDIVSDPIPDYLVKRLQRAQLAAASFVLGRYAAKQGLLKLAWLPVVERKEQHLLSNTFKALYFEDRPSYLRLNTVVTRQGR